MNYPIGMTIADREAALPLKRVCIDAHIRDLFCDVTVEQTYANDEQEPIEAVYTFPLPLDAVLLDVEVTLGDKKMRGAVVAKAEAEEKYEEAIVQGDTAIRLELVEPGIYAMNLGNLLPGETASISFRYGQLLRWSGDVVRFHLPTTIAPKYGDSQLAPHHQPVSDPLAENRFSLTVQVAGLLASAAIESPSHNVTTRSRNGIVDLALTSAEAFMDRDFVLNFALADGVRSGASVVRHGEGRVAMLSWRPSIAGMGSFAPRALKIVVDCSGSMGGDSIEQARQGLSVIVQALRPEDTFEIVRFGSGNEALFGSLQPATSRNRAKAMDLVRELQSDMGGTEIGPALEAAYKCTDGNTEIRPDVLLITDGEVNGYARIIKAARVSGHRIFTVGVGASVAEAFVRQLATETGGACELVSPNEEMAGRIVRHFERMYAPKATEVRIEWPGQVQREVLSTTAIFDGDTVYAFAWMKAGEAGVVRVQYKLDHDDIVQSVTIPCESMDADHEYPVPGHPVARVAAATWIANHPADAQRLAVEYQLITEETDFIVVHERAESEKANALPDLRKVTNMLAAGWGGTGSVVGRRAAAGKIPYSTGFSILRCGTSAIPAELMMSATFLDAKESEVRHPVDWAEVCGMIERTIVLDPAAGRLAHCDLKLLLRAQVPAGLNSVIRQVVESGHDEYATVLTFLLELARSSLGSGFSLDAKRLIETAATGVVIDQGARAKIAQKIDDFAHPKFLDQLEESSKVQAG